jgi:hypothetical protein
VGHSKGSAKENIYGYECPYLKKKNREIPNK